MNATTAIQELRQLKAEAREQRRKGDADSEIRLLRSGVQLGQELMATVPQDTIPETLAWEAADCLGMLGGALLREGKTREAIAAYQEGRDLEQRFSDSVRLTYNTVNLIVARLMDGGWSTLAGLQQDLQSVVARLKSRAAGDGAQDVWTWADLGMCEFLAGNEEGAEAAYAKAAALGSTEERKSILGGLQRIEQDCQPIPTDRAKLLQSVKNALGIAPRGA
jgi:hypothetical protein